MTMGYQIKFLVSGYMVDNTIVSMCISHKTFRSFPNWKANVTYPWIHLTEITNHGELFFEIQL